MKNDTSQHTQLQQGAEKKSSRFFMLLQIMTSTLLLICALFGIFVGVRLLNFIEHKAEQQLSISEKWSEVAFDQLLQMNTTVKQGLDLILEQRKENQALQAEIRQLTSQLNKNQTTPNNDMRSVEERSHFLPGKEGNK